MKSKGAFLIARNNAQIDYVKQAVFLAKRIKKYLDIPTTVLTDSVDYLKSSFDESFLINCFMRSVICGITWTVFPKYSPFLSFLRTSL